MPDALQEFLDAIAAGDDPRTEKAALALSTLGDAALPTMRDMLDAPDFDRRWWATRGLAALGTAAAQQLLIAQLEDPSPDVRACAALGLAKLRPPEAVKSLVARLSDPSAYVARVVADALGQFGQPAVEPLIAALREGETTARAGAARALQIIQPEEAIPALYEALDDPSATVTHYAKEALERMGVGMVFFQP